MNSTQWPIGKGVSNLLSNHCQSFNGVTLICLIGLSNIFDPVFTSQQLVPDLWGPKSPPSGAGKERQGGRSSPLVGSPSCRVWGPFCLRCRGNSLGWRVHEWFVEDVEYGKHLGELGEQWKVMHTSLYAHYTGANSFIYKSN